MKSTLSIVGTAGRVQVIFSTRTMEEMGGDQLEQFLILDLVWKFSGDELVVELWTTGRIILAKSDQQVGMWQALTVRELESPLF